MRQWLSNRKVRALASRLNLPIVAVLVRGNTDHRRDLCLEDGRVLHLFKDGSIYDSGLKHQCKEENHE